MSGSQSALAPSAQAQGRGRATLARKRQAVDGFLSSVLTVKRIALHEAIEQFIAFRKDKTVLGAGQNSSPSW